MDSISDIEAQLLAMSRPSGDDTETVTAQPEQTATETHSEVTPATPDPETIASPKPSPSKKPVAPLLRIVKRAMDHTADPVIIYTPDLKVIYANAAARKLWPVAFERLENGQPFYEAALTQIRAIHPELSEEKYAELAKLSEAAHRAGNDTETYSAKGRWIRLSHNPISSDFICSIGIDVTEERQLREDIEAARKTAEVAQEASSSFLARMSHEIKTPLNAIVGMSDALLEEDDITQETRETMEFILTAADGLSHLLGQTLDHARIVSGEIKIDYNEDNPAELVRNIAGMWKAQCEKKGIDLRIRVNSNADKPIWFDRYRYQQILNNLLSNAVKFTSEGDITVVLKTVSTPGRPDRLALAVKDSGIGMDKEAASRIFDAYEQASIDTQRKFGGTGLGLNIAQTLSQAMNGTITVKSELGAGATFIVVIPAHSHHPDEKPDPAPTSAPENEEKPETPFSGLNVLCVEDNPVNQVVVKKLIGKQVHSISFAEDGKVALEILALQKFDVVLMDIHMPNMNGIETTQKIRSSEKPWANVCIIALTADPDFQYAKVCRNIGMNDAIGKPVRRQDILDAIGRSLDSLKDRHAQKIVLPSEDAA